MTKHLENTASRIIIPPSFVMDLECQLCQIGAFDRNKFNEGFVVDNIIQAKFQADSILVHRYKNDLSDFILSTDSDFQAYASLKSIIIKTIKIYTNWKKNDNSQNSLGTFSISGTSNVQMVDLQNLLSFLTNISWSTVQYPVLNCLDHWIRALTIIALGCDVYPQGIVGF